MSLYTTIIIIVIDNNMILKFLTKIDIINIDLLLTFFKTSALIQKHIK